jgi:hypothetical protein
MYAYRNSSGVLALLLPVDNEFVSVKFFVLPIPLAARSEAWVCGRSLAGIVGSNPAGGMDVCVVFVVLGQ